MWFSNPISKLVETRILNMHHHVHCSIIRNSQDMEETCIYQ
jgi:hypothetical protein